ncbi:hypothetical protein KY366_02180 [Candidatus Woesearchaeota archaeon]|nr:hypothetical protein [Candidatus Woesearchaeota archaeon]
MAEENKEAMRCRTILEVLGKPKEHVEEIIKKLVEKVKENPDSSVLSEKFAEIKPQGETMFSTFVELEIIFKGIESMIDFCFEFMPSSIEVEKPEQLTLRNRDITDFFNDLQARLHDTDMAARTLQAERDMLKRNFKIMIGNMITVLIKIGRNTLEDLSKYTGINKEEIQKHIEKLVEEGKIKEEGGVFTL